MEEIHQDYTDSTGGIDIVINLHSEAKSLLDEWSGITDPVTRRKLQNRLNQRAARQ